METSSTRLTKPLNIWLIRIVGLGIILVSIGINFFSLPRFFDDIKNQGMTQDIYHDAGIVIFVSSEAAQKGVSVGDKILNPEEDTLGEIGTTVTLKIQTKDGSVRDVQLVRKVYDSGAYGGTLLGLSAENSITIQLAFTYIPIIFAGIVSLLIYWLRSDDWMAVLTSIMLVTMATKEIFSNPFVSIFYIITNVLSFLWFILFPNGKFSPRWSWLLALLPLPANVYEMFTDLGVLTWNTQIQQITSVTGLLFFITMLALMAYRYKKIFSPIERQQSKWVIISFITGIIPLLVWVSYNLYYEFSNQFDKSAVASFIGNSIIVFLNIILILGILFSILRYRLWDIDFIINRSLVYGAMTAMLAIIFGGSLFLVSLFVQGQSFIIAFGVTAMIAGISFNPARRRIQRFVDQRFYHIEIDYQKNPPNLATDGMTQVLRQTNFGAYKNLELIGRGGMGEVYKSVHPTLGKPVAIKILPTALATQTEYRQRFTREAQVVSQLEHPNIIRIFDSGEQDGLQYMVMEYLVGKDLSQMIQANGKLPLAQALPLVQQIASALDYAHANGFVHRDIKPSNVLLDSDGTRAVLTDFGIAKVNNAHTVMTVTGYMLGTFDYIAPEQIQESAHVDGKADIYALGVMVYQMLTGELPFKHINPGALLIAHLNQPAPDACEVLADIPYHISSAIQQAMAKKPEERFATAKEFVMAMG